MMKNLKIPVLFLIMFVAVSSVHAGGVSAVPSWSIHAYSHLDGYSTSGYELNVEKQVSENRSIRIGVSTYLYKRDNDQLSKWRWSDGTIWRDLERQADDRNDNYRLALEYFFSRQASEKVSVHLGMGPTLGYYNRSTDFEYTDQYISENEQTYSAHSDSYGVSTGLVFTAGFEWKISRTISIRAENQSEFRYQYSHDERISDADYMVGSRHLESESDSHSYRFNLYAFRLGLVYSF